MKRPILIVGAGNVGIGLASYCLYKNRKVFIWSNSASKRSVLEKINYSYQGVVSRDRPIILDQDLRFMDLSNFIIIIATVANAHEYLVKKLRHSVDKSSVIIIIPGCFGSYYYFKKHLGIDNIVEINSSPINSRVDHDGNQLFLKYNPFYYIGSTYREEEISSLFPTGTYVNPMFSTLMNIEMVLHPSIYLYSNRDEFYFYRDGINKGSSKMICEIDLERMEVARRLGMNLPSIPEVLESHYKHMNEGVYPENIIDTLKKTKPFCESPLVFNKKLQCRFISEEVPYRLVPLFSLGRDLGVTMGNVKTLIDRASQLFNVDYYEKGRRISVTDLSD